MYTVTRPVSTHTTIDRALRTKVAQVAKRAGVSQAAVFNTALAEGLKRAGFATRPTARTTARRK